MNVKNPLSTVWWINTALLAALILWGLSLLRSNWQPPAPLIPDYSAALDGAVLPGQLLASDYPSITAQPLFETGRNWPEPAPKVEEKLPEPEPEAPVENILDGVVLQGTYDQAGTGIAILSFQGKSHRLKIGETLEDWTLEEVDSISARLSHPLHGQEVLKFKRAMTPEEKAAAAPAATPARAANTNNAATQRQSQRPATAASRAQAASPMRSTADAPRPAARPTIGGSSNSSAPSK